MAAISAAALGLLLLGFLAVLQSSRAGDNPEAWEGGQVMMDYASNIPAADTISIRTSYVGGVLVVPVVAFIVLLIAAAVRRVPIARSLAGMSSVGLLAMLLYAQLAAVTLAGENRMARDIQSAMQHEGRFYAALSHQPWPGR